MEKINIGTQGYPTPMPLTILGTHLDGRPNYMTLGWVSRVNFKPPLIGIGVNKANETHRAILETGEFSLNFPSADMVGIADAVGLASGRKVDKSHCFKAYYGTLKAAPLIEECPLSMECRLYQTIEFPTNFLFIGEIVGTWSEARFMTDGMPDTDKIRPMVLAMPENRYRTVGNVIGKAWGDGKEIRKGFPPLHDLPNA